MRSFSAAHHSGDLGFGYIGCTLSSALALMYNNLHSLTYFVQHIIALKERRVVIFFFLNHGLLRTTFSGVYG